MTKSNVWKWIAGLVAAIIANIVAEKTTHFNLFAIFAKGFIAFWHWIIHPVSLPLWMAVLLPISGVVFMRAVYWRISRSAKPAAWLLYRKDEFFGVTWIWTYSGGEINQLVPLCPRCEYELENHPMAFYKATGLVTLNCGNCGFQKSLDEPIYNVEDRVRRLIARNIRTQEFPRQ